MREISGLFCTGPASAGEDGITVFGEDGQLQIVNSVFDFRAVPAAEQDEVISMVAGASLRLKNCVILGGIKAILAGNGDHPCADWPVSRLDMENCVILGSGRRCPEAQDGTTIIMRKCWIHDWGKAFDVRAFGAWARRGGRIIAEDCLFTQPRSFLPLGWRTLVQDMVGHVGNAVNVAGVLALFSSRTWLSGGCRGLTAETETGGFVLASRCYRNRRWIRIDNCSSFLPRSAAREIVVSLEKACPDVGGLTGSSLTEIFDQTA